MSSLLKKFHHSFFGLVIFLSLPFFVQAFLDDFPILLMIIKLLTLFIFFSAIFSLHHQKPIKYLLVFLLIPIIGSYYFNEGYIGLIGLISSILFFFLVTINLIQTVFVDTKEIDKDTIFGAISIYLLIGIIFGLFYSLIEILNPGSIHYARLDPSYSMPHIGTDLSYIINHTLYFSFVTQTTVGYGDLIPLSRKIQTLAVFQAIIAQFYIAVLVARLISLYKVKRSKEK